MEHERVLLRHANGVIFAVESSVQGAGRQAVLVNHDLTAPQKKYFVYVISDGTAVKVGRSDDPKRRLKGLQTGNPRSLEIVHVVEFSTELESARYEKHLHTVFASRKAHGEWFAIEPDLVKGWLEWDREYLVGRQELASLYKEFAALAALPRSGVSGLTKLNIDVQFAAQWLASHGLN